MTLAELCDAIEAGYDAGKSGFEDDMISWLFELGDRTDEIKALIHTPEQRAALEMTLRHYGDDQRVQCLKELL